MCNNFSFKKGWNQIKRGDSHAAMEKIIKALGLKFRTSFCARLNGKIEPKISEAKAIEQIFAEYGITDIWGNE